MRLVPAHRVHKANNTKDIYLDNDKRRSRPKSRQNKCMDDLMLLDPTNNRPAIRRLRWIQCIDSLQLLLLLHQQTRQHPTTMTTQMLDLLPLNRSRRRELKHSMQTLISHCNNITKLHLSSSLNLNLNLNLNLERCHKPHSSTGSSSSRHNINHYLRALPSSDRPLPPKRCSNRHLLDTHKILSRLLHITNHRLLLSRRA